MWRTDTQIRQPLKGTAMQTTQRRQTNIDKFKVLFWASVITLLLSGLGNIASSSSPIISGLSTGVYTGNQHATAVIKAAPISTRNSHNRSLIITDEQTGEDYEEESFYTEKTVSNTNTRLSDNSFLATSPNTTHSLLPLYQLFEVYRT